MPIRLLLRLTLLAGLIAPGYVFALGVGQMAVRSALNENLNADIPLIASNPGELMGLTVQIPRQQEFDQVGAERLAFFSKLRFAVQTPPGGPNIIKVTSIEPIRNPNFNLLLELVWPRGRLLREFTVQVDPDLYPNRQQPPPLPAPAVPLAPVAAAPTSTAAPRPAVDLPPAPSVSFEGASSYGPVKSGETLSGIARRMRPSTTISIPQMMSILVAGNPDAFANGDPNTLRRGVTLRVPTAQALGMEATAAVPPPSEPSTLDTTAPPATDSMASQPTTTPPPVPPATVTPPSAPPITVTPPPVPPATDAANSQATPTATPPVTAVPPSTAETPPVTTVTPASPTPPTPLSPSELPQEIVPQTPRTTATSSPTDATTGTATGTATNPPPIITDTTTSAATLPNPGSTTESSGVATAPVGVPPAEPASAQPTTTPAPITPATPATPVRPSLPVQPVVETEPDWLANPVILLGGALILLAVLALLSLPFLRRRAMQAQAAANADEAFVRTVAETPPPSSRPLPPTTGRPSALSTPTGATTAPPSVRSQTTADKHSALLMPGTTRSAPPASASGDPPTRAMRGAVSAAALVGAATAVNSISGAPSTARSAEPKSVADLLKEADFGLGGSSSMSDDTIAADGRRTALPETRLAAPSPAHAVPAGQGASGADLPSVLQFDDLDFGAGDRSAQKTTLAPSADRPPLEMKPAAQQGRMDAPTVIDRPEPATEPVSLSSFLPILSGDSAADETVITNQKSPAPAPESSPGQPFDLELDRMPSQVTELPPLEMKVAPPTPAPVEPPMEIDLLKPTTGSIDGPSGLGLADPLPLDIDRLEPATESHPATASLLGAHTGSLTLHDKETTLSQGDTPLPPDAHQFDFADITQELQQPADDISLTKLDEDLRSFGDDKTLELREIVTEADSYRDQLKGDPADYMETKLDLAVAFLDMGDPVGARGLLDQVLKEGDAEQKQRATELLKKLS